MLLRYLILLISVLKLELFILYNKLVIAIIANYLISIQFFRIYNRKSIVKRFETKRLISLVITKINKNINKKEIKIKIKIKIIKITIIKKTIILIIKKLVRNIKNLKKKTEFVIAKIAIKTKIKTTIIVKNNLCL